MTLRTDAGVAESAVIVQHGRERPWLGSVLAKDLEHLLRETAFVHGHSLERPHDERAVTPRQQELRQPRDLKEGDVPGFAELTQRARILIKARRVGHVHDDQSLNWPQPVHREVPGNHRAPVVAAEQYGLRA